MAEQISAPSNHLHQSQWWVRLAAISERREAPTAATTQPVEKEQSIFRKTLASLFSADRDTGLPTILAKTT